MGFNQSSNFMAFHVSKKLNIKEAFLSKIICVRVQAECLIEDSYKPKVVASQLS